MIKVLFLIHDLGQGGAEKVLVNLVNNMDPARFDISVTALFGGGVNEQFLAPHIHYRAVWPREIRGNSHIMKLLTPKQLHRICVKEHYDIEISYLEGPSARVVSGCTDPATKLVSWIHCTIGSKAQLVRTFRHRKEAEMCYLRFDKMVFVAETVRQAFMQYGPQVKQTQVLYNTNESAKILQKADDTVGSDCMQQNEINLIAMGRIVPVKGYDRLARVHAKLRAEGYPVHTYILGQGSQQEEIVHYLAEKNLEQSFTFLGYHDNPYAYLACSDLFVCSSYSEGFSTAATEALIVGTPVCTVEVSGMKEMLGENNEYGVVIDNDEEALYQGIKSLLDDPALLAHYREKAAERGRMFSTENTVKAVEDMLLSLMA
ncbi:MAG: glycosyltransferase [Clostridia bacterium]|nr:glycosyltransferase [Clostridia bacterium]